MNRNIFYSYFSQFVRLLVGFGILYLLTENLSIENFGKFNVINSVLSILGVIVSFGIEPVIIRYVAEFDKDEKKKLSYYLINKVVKIRIVSIIFIALIFILNIEFFVSKLGLNSLEVLFVPILLMFTRINTLIGVSFLTAILQVYREKKIQIFYDLMKLVGFYFLAHYNRVEYLMLFWIALELISFVYFGMFYHRYYKNQNDLNCNDTFKKNKSRILTFAKYKTLGGFLFILIDFASDKLMISYMLSNEKVAIYSFGMGLIAYMSYLNPSFLMKNYFTSLLTSLSSNSDKKDLINKFNFLFRITIVIIIPFYFVFLINIEDLISILFKKEYVSAIPLIITGIFFYFFKDIAFVFSPMLNLFEKNKWFLNAGLLSIFNVITNLILIPKFGIMGALYGTGTTWVLIFIYYLYKFKGFFKSYDFFPSKDLIYSLLLCTVLYFIISLIPNLKSNNLYLLLLNITWQLLTIFLIMYKLKIIKYEDIQILKKIIKQ